MVDWEDAEYEEEGQQQVGLILASNRHPELHDNKIIQSWKSNSHGSFEYLKFKYDDCNLNWVNLDNIIATVTLTYILESCFFKLERNNADNLNEFVSKKN